ncbi:MAG TPA: hypothetical protein VGF55_09565 [Gemmataceae bacterium]|jgi:hypothetical protein
MAKIDGIKLPANLGASLSGTPEEAAKAFQKAVSVGMAQVVANALVAAASEAVGGGSAPDWFKLVKGCALDLGWETPGGTGEENAVGLSSGQGQALGAVEVGVSVRASF